MTAPSIAVPDPTARHRGEEPTRVPTCAPHPPAVTSAACEVGRGRYELLHHLGSGAMGTVHAAHDRRRDRVVAVKRLHPISLDDELGRARFRAEARFVAEADHPGLPTILDHGEDVDGASSTPYLVLRLVPGESLADVIASGGPLPSGEALELVRELAEALASVHARGVVHRDVKPGNVIVQPDGRPVLIDFGIATAPDLPATTRPGELLGTMDYISPEQVIGDPATPAADVYSLGVLAHRCLSGARPFLRETPEASAAAHVHDPAPALPIHVPAAARRMVEAMLAKDPAARPIAREVAAGLDAREHLASA